MKKFVLWLALLHMCGMGYLLTAFVNWNWNPERWPALERGALGGWCLLWVWLVAKFGDKAIKEAEAERESKKK
jgi:hypothetical protein